MSKLDIKYEELKEQLLAGSQYHYDNYKVNVDQRKKVNLVELWCVKEHLVTLSGDELKTEILFLIDNINKNLKPEIGEELANIFRQYPEVLKELRKEFVENAIKL